MSEKSKDDAVGDGKLVELTYKVVDAKSNSTLTEVEYPIGYVHGISEILAPQVTAEIEGKFQDDVINVPVSYTHLTLPTKA